MIRRRKLKGKRNLDAFFGTRQAPRTVLDSVFRDDDPLIQTPILYWRSCAEWPEGLIVNLSGEGRNVTKDKHDTEEQAQGVCDLLRKNGFGGERIHFPVRTWTEPVTDETIP